MITTDGNGWIIGDATAEPVEKLKDCNPPPTPLYSCERPSNFIAPTGSNQSSGERLLLRPAHETINFVYPSPGYERSKILRAAVAQWVRSCWGEHKRDDPWAPTDERYEPIRKGLEILFAHKLWERFDVLGSILHFAIPKREIAATVDLAVRFRDGGGLGLIGVWNGPDMRIHSSAPWADLGAAAEAMEINGLPVDKLIVLYVSNEQVKIEVQKGSDQGVNDCIVTWFSAVTRAAQIKAAEAYCSPQRLPLEVSGVKR